ISNIDLKHLFALHAARQELVTMVSVPLISPYGILQINDESRIDSFAEKPELPFWMNAGIYMVKPEVASLLPEKSHDETSTFPLLAEEGHIRAFKTRDLWRSVDTIKEWTELQRDFDQADFAALLRFELSSG
ncbi:MAG: hypothetical protein K2Z81_03730, partial [Cyanobacteria bacterium]|nr:hypothetical protein [Cyanobacteriota bacterium]